MSNQLKLMLLVLLIFISTAVYLFWDMSEAWQYALSLRLKTVLGILVTGVAVGISTLIFHTIVNNRVVTPQTLGLDKLYDLSKTLIIYIFGASTLLSLNIVADYFISLFLMLIFALMLGSLVK